MKRALSILLTAMLLLSSPITPALAAVDLELGVDTEFVIERKVELKDAGLDADYSAQYYDVYTTLVIGDNLVELTPKGGIQTFQATVDGTPVGSVDAKGGIGWNIGLDAKINAVQTEYVDLAVIGGYRFSRTDLDRFDINGVETDNPIETIVYTHEWEIGAQLEKDLSTIEAFQDYITVPCTPYIGVVYSDLMGEIRANTSAITGTDMTQDIRAKNKVGIRTGLGFQPIEDLTISIDAKFVDQTAIGASVAYKF
jgi:hypothetical protein